jgi:hypothetical protein
VTVKPSLGNSRSSKAPAKSVSIDDAILKQWLNTGCEPEAPSVNFPFKKFVVLSDVLQQGAMLLQPWQVDALAMQRDCHSDRWSGLFPF